ncbi:MAG: hypothetical protein DME85_12220 [Verrucomicrobia bacterium]|nr:MAG: hypothetical protein DME85_12220 [Verrucomicrobiota bacterium]
MVFALRDETFSYFVIVLERPFGLEKLPPNFRAVLVRIWRPADRGDERLGVAHLEDLVRHGFDMLCEKSYNPRTPASKRSASCDVV